MFQDYFGIAEDPFSITPDPKYLYLSERHRNGFAHLLYGVTEGGGFMQLTGDVGTGKTLLCRKLLAELPEAVDVAFIFNPRMSPLELVAAICDELKILYPTGCSSIKDVVDFLNAYLLESHSQGRRTVVIIDEAQNLSYESLEQVRLLTNLETPTQKLLQIILVGQPELRSLLQRAELRQLAQRVTARYHLTPLSRSETRAYVLHRLKVAGIDRPLFTPGALRLLYKLSGGVPRVINILCNRGMLLGFGKNTARITRRMIKQVSDELSGIGEETVRKPYWVGVTAVIVSIALAGLFLSEPVLFPGRSAKLSSVEAQTEHRLEKEVESDVQSVDAEAENPGAVEAAGETHVAGPSARASGMEVISETGDPSEPDLVGMAADEINAPLAAPRQPQPPESPPSLAGMMGNEHNIFATLFGYWQTVYPMDGESRSSCDKAEEVGLSCIYGRGSWDSLAYYNRPAVLELIMDDGQRYHVVATALSDDAVMLDLNGRRFSFSRADIGRLWTGSYIVLWRPPKIKTGSLSLGQVGSDVGWLISMLDRVEGVQSAYDSLNATFGRELQQRVMRFQRSHELLADGIVGKQTLIRLNGAVSDSTKPSLRRVGG
ncbi:MAG: AAA family ATPase [Candidatus Thiodiazotropha sp. (ex Dulcina madagascariensis)]|nr:AAA family ATPase [Candidatus Thiodiazotropha sp. (ex Dulcina madagascariensis)]MCU7928046.1 AAA family ATPase [Candidatus Thiodiazotropha sp. (ex Dulcina madagascariensis)]